MPDPTDSSPSKPEATNEPASLPAVDATPVICDICGSSDLEEIRCKLICRNCKTILQTCGDL